MRLVFNSVAFSLSIHLAYVLFSQQNTQISTFDPVLQENCGAWDARKGSGC